jgi:uncharacterized protein
MAWELNKVSKQSIKNPTLIEGLPGVGNVGKIAVEYLIDVLKAKKAYEITSSELPHYVFVNEDNILEMPSIDIYSAKIGTKDILLLSGDMQPPTESACHSFCTQILDNFEKTKGKEIITLGGIALREMPEDPEIYFTANSKAILKKYSNKEKPKRELHEFIGPIMGVTGVLPGLAAKRKIPALTMLAETHENPGHVGLEEARKIIKHLNKKLNLKLKNREIDSHLKLNSIITQKKKEKKLRPHRPTRKQVKKAEPKQEESENNSNSQTSYIG